MTQLSIGSRVGYKGDVDGVGTVEEFNDYNQAFVSWDNSSSYWVNTENLCVVAPMYEGNEHTEPLHTAVVTLIDAKEYEAAQRVLDIIIAMRIPNEGV